LDGNPGQESLQVALRILPWDSWWPLPTASKKSVPSPQDFDYQIFPYKAVSFMDLQQTALVEDTIAMEPTKTRSAGGIVLGEDGTIALITDSNVSPSWWLFPKGHLDAGETDEQAARREIAEETGLTDLELLDDLGSYERFKVGQGGVEDKTELKTVRMFLFAAPKEAKLAPSMEIAAAAWIPFRDVAEKLSHPVEKTWFAGVFGRVREAIQRD
jgi:8-oxo-dGTP pyrophosphatase MutT (NUDIX family)